MSKVLASILKIVIASLMAGAVLSALNISAAEILAEIGMTPEAILGMLQKGAEWAIPNLVLGSLVIIPIWLVTMLLRPPKS